MNTSCSKSAETITSASKSLNLRSYKKLQKLMQAGQLLTIDRLGQDKEAKPYLHIKSGKHEFYYFVKQSSWDGIRRYLDDGVVVDFDQTPNEGIIPEEGDFKFSMFEGFIKEGLSPVLIESLREYQEYLTFKLNFHHGSITFSFKRTEELVEKIAELDSDYDL